MKTPMHVLIVDDKEENLYYLQVLLTGHGYKVETARHGAEALFKARQDPPDLVISDLLMPIMDGYTLLSHWKADTRLKHVPFIVYTATYTEAEDERLAMNLGADAFILKPAEPEEFLARVREVQANSAAAVPTPPRHQIGEEKALLKVYSETLIRKLEEKSLQLEESNRRLQQDVTERIQAEEKLRESEERFRATFEQAAVGIAHVGIAGEFLRVNDKLCEITGYHREELVRLSYNDLTVPEDRAHGDAALLAMLAHQEDSSSLEKRYRRKNGEIFWVNIVTRLWRDQDGRSKYFISVIEDISQRKKLEEQFLRAQRMESLGTLAGGIAHDLNNLLTPIVMGVELLKQKTLDEEARAIIATVQQSARRGAELVRQVLSFSRGVEGARVTIRLDELMREIESIVANTFPKNITFERETEQDLWMVLGDQTQLNQVILNLCVNARDSMPNGGRLIIRVRNRELDEQYAVMHRGVTAGHYVVLEVADTGCGMPPEIIDRIFEPFFTTKELGKGTGLGLSTAVGIVRSHGGFMTVYSEPGKGSVFRVHLPAQLAGAPPKLAAAELETLPRGAGELILVVDDETAILNITRQTLEVFGYRVIPAEDGAQAISLYALQAQEIAVVVTDMMMPVMDGMMLIAALQRINPAVCIIAASGLDTNAAVARAASAGVRHFLTKPYTAETVLTELHRILSGQARRHGSRPPV